MILFNLPNYQAIEDTTPTYQSDAATADTVYDRWQNNDVSSVIIRKTVVVSDVTTTTYAYDTWANRATATYLSYLEFMASAPF